MINKKKKFLLRVYEYDLENYIQIKTIDLTHKSLTEETFKET